MLYTSALETSYILALYKMPQYQGLGELGLTWIFWWWQVNC